MAIITCANSDCRYRFPDSQASCPECGELNRHRAEEKPKPEIAVPEGKGPAPAADPDAPTQVIEGRRTSTSHPIQRGGQESVAAAAAPKPDTGTGARIVRGSTEYFSHGETIATKTPLPVERPGASPPGEEESSRRLPPLPPISHAGAPEAFPGDVGGGGGPAPAGEEEPVRKSRALAPGTILPPLEVERKKGPVLWVLLALVGLGAVAAGVKFGLPLVLPGRKAIPIESGLVRVPSGYGEMRTAEDRIPVVGGSIALHGYEAASDDGRWFVEEGEAPSWAAGTFTDRELLEIAGRGLGQRFGAGDASLKDVQVGGRAAIRITFSGTERGRSVHVAATALKAGGRMVVYGLVDGEPGRLGSAEAGAFLDSFQAKD